MNQPINKLTWMMENWKPAAALVYTVICIFDFVVFPSWIGVTRMSLVDFMSATTTAHPDIQTELLEFVYRDYIPYTLKNAGLFHISFGALLTGAAVTGAKKPPSRNDE